ncbi:UNKNOWN [Stylonychia lemnae]|uniref:Uncharacterized protein n=1 Tax=Stylonychia lemnae TaxID=5949 RepID=A0A078AVN4_STYLE|nr:UNKNOWN [Stylonychia lemnae]|eukprot:CDW86445.1 UNKNOWN [Stylonychia lemnae]
MTKGKQKKDQLPDQAVIDYQNFMHFMSQQQQDSFTVSEHIFEKVILKKFQKIIQQKDIVAKSTPFSVNLTAAILQEIIQIYFLPLDQKKDDMFLNSDEEPVPIYMDNCKPKGSSLEIRQQPVKQLSKQDSFQNSIADPLDRRSINSYRRTGRQNNVTQVKQPKIVSLIDDKDQSRNQEPNETELDREINEQIANQRKRLAKRDQDLRKKEELERDKNAKRQSETANSLDLDFMLKSDKKNDQLFHIEADGSITKVLKPQVERFPKQIINPLTYSINDHSLHVDESDFNRSKRIHGSHREMSVEYLEEELTSNMYKEIKDQSKVIDSQFSQIQKYMHTRKEVQLRDSVGNLISQTKSDHHKKSQSSRVGSQETFNNMNRTQYSIQDYRQKFDSQNIALTKFEEIKLARMLDISKQQFGQSTFLDQSSLYDSKLLEPIQTNRNSLIDNMNPSITPPKTVLNANLESQPNMFKFDESTLNINDNPILKLNQSKMSKYEALRKSLRIGGNVLVNANPSIVVDDMISVGESTIMQNSFYLPSLIAATPTNMNMSMSTKRKNSMTSRRLDQSMVVVSDYKSSNFNDESGQNLPGVNSSQYGIGSFASSNKKITDRMRNLRTQVNSPANKERTLNQTFTTGTDLNTSKDLDMYLKSKMQPRQVLEKIKQKQKIKQDKLSIGREGAFGELSQANVKNLATAKPFLKFNLRSKLNIKAMIDQNYDGRYPKENKLPPPQLGKTMGHGIIRENVKTSTSRPFSYREESQH